MPSGPIGKRGGFNFLYPASLLTRVFLVHSPAKGKVALWFGGVSGKSGEETIRKIFGAALEDDMTVKGTPAKVLVIFLKKGRQ